MENDSLPIKQLESRVVVWAETQPGIRAILVVGSQARRDHPADEWSDLDLMLFATDFSNYLSHTDWLDDIGPIWVYIRQNTGDGDPELLVLFDGGYKLDFVFYPLAKLQRLAQAATLSEVYRRGYYVLVDKDGLAAHMPAPSFELPLSEPPPEEAFLSAVNAFWYDTVYVAKQIRRRQLWLVKYRDGTIKGYLLQMMAWHAHAVNGWEYDTWHDGKFIAEWTDPPTWQALHQTFGHFAAADSWRALLATIGLFRRLATETASRLGYIYPASLDDQVSQFVIRLYEEDTLLALGGVTVGSE